MIDIHAHLNDERLLPMAAEIVGGMTDANLEAIINVGYDRPSSEIACELAEKYDKLYAVVGIHPHDSKDATCADYHRFEELSKCKKVVAIGEIGLDFYYDLSDRAVQERVFVEQLELAHSLKMPVMLHIRDAYQLAFDILQQNNKLLAYGGVLHCYGGSKEMVDRFNDFDLYYSFGGAVTFKNAKKDEIVRAVPLNRLLLETDCPYMTPVPNRGKLNLPEYIRYVRDKIQEFLPDEDVEGLTTENAKRIFDLQ